MAVVPSGRKTASGQTIWMATPSTTTSSAKTTPRTTSGSSSSTISYTSGQSLAGVPPPTPSNTPLYNTSSFGYQEDYRNWAAQNPEAAAAAQEAAWKADFETKYGKIETVAMSPTGERLVTYTPKGQAKTVTASTQAGKPTITSTVGKTMTVQEWGQKRMEETGVRPATQAEREVTRFKEEKGVGTGQGGTFSGQEYQQYRLRREGAQPSFLSGLTASPALVAGTVDYVAETRQRPTAAEFPSFIEQRREKIGAGIFGFGTKWQPFIKESKFVGDQEQYNLYQQEYGSLSQQIGRQNVLVESWNKAITGQRTPEGEIGVIKDTSFYASKMRSAEAQAESLFIHGKPEQALIKRGEQIGYAFPTIFEEAKAHPIETVAMVGGLIVLPELFPVIAPIAETAGVGLLAYGIVKEPAKTVATVAVTGAAFKGFQLLKAGKDMTVSVSALDVWRQQTKAGETIDIGRQISIADTGKSRFKIEAGIRDFYKPVKTETGDVTSLYTLRGEVGYEIYKLDAGKWLMVSEKTNVVGITGVAKEGKAAYSKRAGFKDLGYTLVKQSEPLISYVDLPTKMQDSLEFSPREGLIGRGRSGIQKIATLKGEKVEGISLEYYQGKAATIMSKEYSADLIRRSKEGEYFDFFGGVAPKSKRPPSPPSPSFAEVEAPKEMRQFSKEESAFTGRDVFDTFTQSLEKQKGEQMPFIEPQSMISEQAKDFIKSRERSETLFAPVRASSKLFPAVKTETWQTAITGMKLTPAYKTLSKQMPLSKEGVLPKSLTETLTVSATFPLSKQDIRPVQKQATIPLQKELSMQKFVPITKTAPLKQVTTVPPPPTPFLFLPSMPQLVLPEGKGWRGGFLREKKGYVPSLISSALNIRALKIPKSSITGFTIRPLIVKGITAGASKRKRKYKRKRRR